MPAPIELVGLLLLLFLAIAAAIGLRLSRNRASTLVLQKFTLAASPLPLPHPTIEIVGRLQGIVAFILSLMGFSPITRLTVAGSEIRCQSSSLFGQRSHFIPLRCVSSCAAGIHKPISAIVWAVVITIIAIYLSLVSKSWAPIALGLVSAVALTAVYVLNKKFFIEVHPQGGPAIVLLFKPNVIEGVPIDVERALAAIAVIRDMILQQGETRSPDVLPVAPDQPSQEAEPSQWSEQLEEEETEELARKRFAEARQLAQSGHRQQAISILQEIVELFPTTDIAQKARRTLQKAGFEV